MVNKVFIFNNNRNKKYKNNIDKNRFRIFEVDTQPPITGSNSSISMSTILRPVCENH